MKNMETSTCYVNHLDLNSLLPPRKRLLAGLKRLNTDVNFPSPSAPSSIGSEHNASVDNQLISNFSDPNLSYEEIVETSRFAAMEAARIAKHARANAEDKAAIAAKAVAAAKNALELADTLSGKTSRKNKLAGRDKMMKQVAAEALYDKKEGTLSCREDEALPQKLQRDINCSARISRKSLEYDPRSHKYKRLLNSVPASSGVSIRESVQPSKTNGGCKLENLEA